VDVLDESLVGISFFNKEKMPLQCDTEVHRKAAVSIIDILLDLHLAVLCKL